MRLAADREASIRVGMAIDVVGRAFKSQLKWLPVAVQVTEAAFQRQLFELRMAIVVPGADARPELRTHWHGNSPWVTDPQLLLDRCKRYAAHFKGRAPPSHSEAKIEKEPPGWRCATWQEVVKRCGSLNLNATYDTSAAAAAAEEVVDVDEEAAAEAAAAGAKRKRAGKQPARGNASKEVAEPCTKPRTLELYCGRAGWSIAHQDQGCDSWYVDWSREAVSPSFESQLEVRERNMLCRNGLDPSRFIHLDFLDLAVAILNGEVRAASPLSPPCTIISMPLTTRYRVVRPCRGVQINVGDLHAIHDGLDCTTFTDLAKAKHERRDTNAFAGTSKEAFLTNLRHHVLVALHLFLRNQGSTDRCVRSAENPKASRQHHPLTVGVLELPKPRGLGSTHARRAHGPARAPRWQCRVSDAKRVCVCERMPVAKGSFANCKVGFDASMVFQKPTNWWTDNPPTLELFLKPSGEQRPEMLCSKEWP